MESLFVGIFLKFGASFFGDGEGLCFFYLRDCNNNHTSATGLVAYNILSTVDQKCMGDKNYYYQSGCVCVLVCVCCVDLKNTKGGLLKV